MSQVKLLDRSCWIEVTRKVNIAFQYAQLTWKQEIEKYR